MFEPSLATSLTSTHACHKVGLPLRTQAVPMPLLHRQRDRSSRSSLLHEKSSSKPSSAQPVHRLPAGWSATPAATCRWFSGIETDGRREVRTTACLAAGSVESVRPGFFSRVEHLRGEQNLRRPYRFSKASATIAFWPERQPPRGKPMRQHHMRFAMGHWRKGRRPRRVS